MTRYTEWVHSSVEYTEDQQDDRENTRKAEHGQRELHGSLSQRLIRKSGSA
jgi:hypothetical protein